MAFACEVQILVGFVCCGGGVDGGFDVEAVGVDVFVV